MSRAVLGLLAAVAALASSCDEARLPPATSKLLDPQGHFTLLVSNQSFAISPVDIRVEIDDGTVVYERFEVGNQHRWKAFKLSLPLGKHTLRVSSAKGEAELSREFEVKGEQWAIIDYWYYPKSHYNPTPKHFGFELLDHAPKFE